VDAPWMRAVRERLRELAPGTPVAGGNNAYFCELNRNPPPTEALDAVVYSLNPQVHAFDELSMVESVAAQAETVTSARALCRDLRVVVSPVTLKPRFNPNATESEQTPPDQPPPPVDPRQMSLFGAAWTLGSLKYLAESGAASVTYYETTGWRGVIETEAGSPLPNRFPSEPGMVFPLYHLLADVAECKAGQLLACHSSDPLAVLGLAVRKGSTLHILLANLTPIPQAVVLGPLEGETASLRRLNTESAPLAMSDPQGFRSAREMKTAAGGQLTIRLTPYELVRMDVPPP
jgi:D-apionolactonase